MKKKNIKIKVTKCEAFGKEFVEIQPGSIHDVWAAPRGKAHLPGVWVMGRTERVRLLPGEFIVLE